RLIALGVGFAGVLVVLQPWSEPLTVALGLALIGALAHAMASLVVKRLTASDRPMTIVAWSFILPIIPAFAASLFVWTWPDAEGWFYVTGVGLFMLAGQCSMVRALSIADATAIMPFEFVRFGFIIAIGVVLFAEMVAMETFAGGALILVSAIYLAIREARRDRTIALVPAARLPADG
ncbi:MAG: DMT family transporter, partial [Pseudomonadota bacterium]